MIDFEELLERCIALGVPLSRVFTVPLQLRYAAPLPDMPGALHLSALPGPDVDPIPIPCGSSMFEDDNHPHHGPISGEQLGELLPQGGFCGGCLVKFSHVDLTVLNENAAVLGPLLDLASQVEYLAASVDDETTIDPMLLGAMFTNQQRINAHLDGDVIAGYSDDVKDRARVANKRVDNAFDTLIGKLNWQATTNPDLAEVIGAYQADRAARTTVS